MVLAKVAEKGACQKSSWRSVGHEFFTRLDAQIASDFQIQPSKWISRGKFVSPIKPMVGKLLRIRGSSRKINGFLTFFRGDSFLLFFLPLSYRGLLYGEGALCTLQALEVVLCQ